MFADYARYYDLFNADKPYKKEIEFVYKWAEEPLSIFDIGAGTCNYWKYYPSYVRLLGIDNSPAMQERGNRVICADVTTFKTSVRFGCATALFEVINYIPQHIWWRNIPIEKGSYFIFDIWDTKKIRRDGFKKTVKKVGDLIRTIRPLNVNRRYVDLQIFVDKTETSQFLCETHRMYLYSHKDIQTFCGKEFEIVEVRPTEKWQTWYRLRKK